MAVQSQNPNLGTLVWNPLSKPVFYITLLRSASRAICESRRTMFFFLVTLSLILAASVQSTKPPHIILIIGDDLGFNDISYRGSEDIHTPNIDALGYAGRILDRHYTLPTCTPSRASLLTGLHAVRTGMQGFPLKVGEPRGLPLNFKILPQFLKELNYSTHLVGKWHIGSHRWAYTPTYRGYDTFLGYYSGYIGYFSHEIAHRSWPSDLGLPPPIGYDLHRNEDVAFDLRGQYASELFTKEAEKLIREHDPEKPLFLQLAQISAHAGQNQTTNEVANETANDLRFGFIRDGHRRRYAGSAKALDDSVGRIIHALDDRNMLTDSLVVFFNDNGGLTTGMFNNSGSNWPLRGQKQTLYEGGVRTAAVMWHKNMQPTSEPHMDLFHITDWLPTLYEASGGKVENLGKIDGVSHWHRLSGKLNLSVTLPPRSEFLINSQEKGNKAFMKNWWKYVKGGINFPESYTKLMGDPGRTSGRQYYNLSNVVHSETMKRLFQASGQEGYDSLKERAANMRKLLTLPSACRDNATEDLNCTAGCLFNLRDDPCETRNIANHHPHIVSTMQLKLSFWDTQSVPLPNTIVDFVNSDPRKFGGAWVPWLDMQRQNSTASNVGSREIGHFHYLVVVLTCFIVIYLVTSTEEKCFKNFSYQSS